MKSINNDLLISRIEEMAKEKNLKMNAVFVESGAGKNFKSNLKTANPSLGKLTLIANYLGTTVAYLTGETDKKEKPPEKSEGVGEDEVRAFEKTLEGLTQEELQKVLSYAEFLKQQRNS